MNHSRKISSFANFQIQLTFEEISQNFATIVIYLSGDLQKQRGWKKRTFICRSKESITGTFFIPTAHSEDIEILRPSQYSGDFEVKLEGEPIRLFPIRGIEQWF